MKQHLPKVLLFVLGFMPILYWGFYQVTSSTSEIYVSIPFQEPSIDFNAPTIGVVKPPPAPPKLEKDIYFPPMIKKDIEEEPRIMSRSPASLKQPLEESEVETEYDEDDWHRYDNYNMLEKQSQESTVVYASKTSPSGISLESLVGAIGSINSIIMGWYVIFSNRRKEKEEG